MENLTPEPSNFRNHVLPLARIKKIMKMDEEVKMISVETPLLISKACELFIIELAYRGWAHTLEANRRTLQRNDIAQAISNNDFYDFLLDIVEESCKNKLLYSGHTYSKVPPVPLLGFFDNYDINNNEINFNRNYLLDANNNLIEKKDEDNKNNLNQSQSEFFSNFNYANNNIIKNNNNNSN